MNDTAAARAVERAAMVELMLPAIRAVPELRDVFIEIGARIFAHESRLDRLERSTPRTARNLGGAAGLESDPELAVSFALTALRTLEQPDRLVQLAIIQLERWQEDQETAVRP